ncbi:restriction endonuclease subunit S [Ligilactobacillus equi]
MGQSPSSKNYTNNPNDEILVQGNADLENGTIKPRIYTTQITKKAFAGDIIMSVRAPVGDVAKTQYDVVIGRGVAAISGNEFIYQLLGNMKQTGYWSKYISGSTFESVTSADVKSTTISIPLNAEQHKIGRSLSKLDDTITLHEEKLAKLKQLKQGFLQKMFADESGKPLLRFKGFNDAWEQRKLGEVVKRVKIKNINNESQLPLTISAQYGLIAQSEFYDRQIASKDLSNYLLLHEGDFAYNKSYSNGYPYGAIKRLDRYKSGVVSSLYIAFTPTKLGSDFLSQYYESNFWNKEIYKRAAEGARNHGLLNISPVDFFDSDIMAPKIDEQKQIGNFFQQLDTLIALQHRKLEQLKKLKKSLLQNMFI